MLYQRINKIVLGNFYLGTLGRFGLDCRLSLTELNNFIDEYGADYMQVCIVGSNPSTASLDSSAFAKGTKSRTTVDSWFDDENYCIHYTNIVNYKKANNKALTKSEIKRELPKIKQRFKNRSKTKIITVGKTAHEALELAGVPHFEMPHPSGLCRFWNDKKAAEAKIQEMLAWLKN